MPREVDDVKRTLDDFPTPPEASLPMRRMARRIAAPVENFLHTESASGLLLLGAAAIALVWANSPWSDSYGHLWHTPISIGFGDWSMTESLHFWINDGLMTFFFMVAGLEIKRELVEGELSDLKRASLPVAAAVGGMLVPAGIYFAFNTSGPGADGWGVPMATDIAFAVGILSLLGSRVPSAMRILLLAVAIIDDIGAILVIAIFYSTGFSWTGMAIVGGGLAFLIFIQRIGVRPGGAYIIPMIVMWAGLHEAGIHPTIAGVIVGLATPVRPWLSGGQFIRIAQESLAEFRQTEAAAGGEDALTPLKRLSVAGREAVSPVARLNAGFHPWVAYLIMPLFAIANAGVNLGGMDFDMEGGTMVMLGVACGLALGKPIGVVFVTWVMVKLGLCKLPRGIGWAGVTIIGLAAGIGFTMAIFIAELAFPGSPYLGLAKLAILIATAAAAIGALLLGRFTLPPQVADPFAAKLSAAEAEASTEF
jgi:NhaA family Na+:H+ antiporter